MRDGRLADELSADELSADGLSADELSGAPGVYTERLTPSGCWSASCVSLLGDRAAEQAPRDTVVSSWAER